MHLDERSEMHFPVCYFVCFLANCLHEQIKPKNIIFYLRSLHSYTVSADVHKTLRTSVSKENMQLLSELKFLHQHYSAWVDLMRALICMQLKFRPNCFAGNIRRSFGSCVWSDHFTRESTTGMRKLEEVQ